MESSFSTEKKYIDAKKRVKNILGFYTHLVSTIFIIPFIIFLNLELVPQYHWFWFYLGAWFIGLFIHWFVLFGLSKLTTKKDWKQSRIKEIMNEGSNTEANDIASDFTQEIIYMDAKKRVKEVKGFYTFLIVTMFTIPMIVYINLEFVPEFHFFWFVVVGMLFALFMMWLGIFGFEQFGLGKSWQEKKIKELMSNNISK